MCSVEITSVGLGFLQIFSTDAVKHLIKQKNYFSINKENNLVPKLTHNEMYQVYH